jgi:hypothetical protein
MTDAEVTAAEAELSRRRAEQTLDSTSTQTIITGVIRGLSGTGRR